MSKEVLQVKMFGGFCLFYEGRRIRVGRDINSRLLQLMQLLLLNTEADGIPKASLIRILYGREEIENGNASLNSAIFRLRKNLKKAGLPDCEYVILQDGRCRWNKEIPVEVDVLQFEQLIQDGQAEKDISRRMDLYLKACRLYTGEFLPGLVGEEWAKIRNVSCQELYTAVLTRLCEWLMQQERFEEVYQLTGTAAAIYPFGNWNLYRIDSLIAMSRCSEALKVYEDVTRLYFDELGLPPSREMLERAHTMAERLSQSEEVFPDIQQRILERGKEEGAYYCTYPNFIDIYRVISRINERRRLSAFVLIYTFADSRKNREPEEQETARVLKESIMSSLRQGDFFTRYSQQQYLVLLTGLRREDCEKVSARIETAFRKNIKRSTCQLDSSVFSIEEINEN